MFIKIRCGQILSSDWKTGPIPAIASSLTFKKQRTSILRWFNNVFQHLNPSVNFRKRSLQMLIKCIGFGIEMSDDGNHRLTSCLHLFSSEATLKSIKSCISMIALPHQRRTCGSPSSCCHLRAALRSADRHRTRNNSDRLVHWINRRLVHTVGNE